ncbi:MAG: hypothetical protein GY913_29340 [Proteobacteria bacterium]|nr:hypothetical protein [Pseudomonadota bacterium]MCP4921020.1 hypothetical protein [Pseudomonadota bacterium]
MNAVIYVLVAALAAVLAGRATYRGGGRDPLRRTFAVLCALTALTYTSFSLYLFPALSAARFPFAVAGAFLPVATLQFMESFFARQGEQPTRLLRQLWVATPIVAIGYLAGELVFFRDQVSPGVLEFALGALVYAGFGVNLFALWRRHEASEYRVEKARIRYLLGFMAAAVGFSGLEGADRILTVAPDAAALPLIERSVELQGNLPPIGALFAGLFLFFLYQVLTMERLLDLTEIFSRIVSVAATALVLVLISAAAVLWFAAASNPVQTLFHLFVASVLFLLAYDPIRHRIQDYVDRWFNIRGHQLAQALDELDLALPKIIALDDLSHTLLERLHSSGRVPALSLYVYEPERNQVRLVAQKASGDHRPMPTVALHPFAEGFEAGAPAYVREHLERRRAITADRSEEFAVRLRIMDGLDADLVVPMRTGELVLGWLAIRDEEWSDGFSQEEITRMVRTMSKAATVVENIKGFEAAKERSRLAALGTMSAGLAHEIRNPLAGIKGAAQYLQTLDSADEEAQEFLEVITQETDRLNAVVSSFLDYARHFELHRQPTDVSGLVAKVLKLVRAQGVPEGITLAEDLDGDLVEIPVDGDKLRQVVLNLVQNAIQALSGGGQIHVSTSRGYLTGSKAVDTRALLITVADDGPGIPPEIQDKLFIPFFTTKHGGTGLGLPICQRILKAHGGELSVESRPGAGATFIVRLPVPTLQVTER